MARGKEDREEVFGFEAILDASGVLGVVRSQELEGAPQEDRKGSVKLLAPGKRVTEHVSANFAITANFKLYQ